MLDIKKLLSPPPHDEAERARKRNRPILGWLYRLKDWTEHLATKPYAVPALFLLSFAESSFFPIPPDVLLIALCVGLSSRSFYYATVCTAASVLGGLAGYAIGYFLWYHPGSETYTAVARFFFDIVPGFTEERFLSVRDLYQQYDFWVVFTAGFTPIPYKLITISAGVFDVNVWMFTIASLVGRAGRFFLVALFFYVFGAPVQHYVEAYLEHLTLAFVVLLIGGFVVIKYIL